MPLPARDTQAPKAPPKGPTTVHVRELLAATALALCLLATVPPAATAQVQDRADLSVEELTWTLEGPERDPRVVFNLTVANDGPEEARDVMVDLTTGNGTRIASTWHARLGVGNTSTVELEWLNAPPGQHTVQAEIDPDQSIEDPDRADNVATTTLTVPDPDDVHHEVHITPDQATDRLAPGEHATRVVNVTNAGEAGGWFELRVDQAPANLTVSTPGPTHLDPGQHRATNVSVWLHHGAEHGQVLDYRLVATGPRNASAIGTFQVEVTDPQADARPDLTVAAYPVDLGGEPAESNETGTWYTAEVANRASGAAQAFTVRFTLAGEEGEQSHEVQIDGLGAFERDRVRAGPFQPGSGEQELVVTVDPLDQVAETDETNNEARQRLHHVAPTAPLTLPPISLASLENGTATHEIRLPARPGNPPTTYQLALSELPAGWTADPVPQNVTVQGPDPGHATIVLHVPEDQAPTRPGTGPQVRLDVVEAGTGANATIHLQSFQVPERPEALPLVEVHTRPPEGSLAPGQRVTFTVQVVDVTGTGPRVTLSLLALPDGWQAGLDETQVQLAPNGTATVDGWLQVPEAPGPATELRLGVEASTEATTHGPQVPEDGQAPQTWYLHGQDGKRYSPSATAEDEVQLSIQQDGLDQATSRTTTAAGPVMVLALASLGALALLAGAWAATRERVQHRFWLLLAPLYSRIASSQVLDHETREAIHETVADQPGIHYTGLKNELSLSKGTLTYHLRVLEREDVLTSRNDGRRKRFYAVGQGARFEPLIPEARLRVLEAIRAHPGASQSDLARDLGLSRQLVHHHVHELVALGMVELQRRGRASRAYLTEAGRQRV